MTEPRWNTDRGGRVATGGEQQADTSREGNSSEGAQMTQYRRRRQTTLADTEDSMTRWRQCGIGDTVRLRRLSSTTVLGESELRV
ncbi:hypothetical protein HN51_038668 [Arachis hypogaea]